jgi:signal recognition particle GTPase
MSQSQRAGSQSQYEEPFPRPSAAVPAATMVLMAGLPGAGKTTRARQLAAASRARRLTPDH